MFNEWYKVLRGAKVTPEEQRRAKICEGCPHRTYSKYLEFIDSEIEEVQGHYCNKCGCPLVAKLKSTKDKDICKKWL